MLCGSLDIICYPRWTKGIADCLPNYSNQEALTGSRVVVFLSQGNSARANYFIVRHLWHVEGLTPIYELPIPGSLLIICALLNSLIGLAWLIIPRDFHVLSRQARLPHKQGITSYQISFNNKAIRCISTITSKLQNHFALWLTPMLTFDMAYVSFVGTLYLYGVNGNGSTPLRYR